MKNFISLVARQYRLGFCGTLVAIDALLLLVFLADIFTFVSEGYGAGTLETPPTGSELNRAFVNALGATVFVLLLLPLLVALVRVLVTPLKLPTVDWPSRRIVVFHILLTLLIAIGIVACVRMEVVSGLKLGLDGRQVGYVYKSLLERLPITMGQIVLWFPSYLKSVGFWLKVGGLILAYFTGREILREQRIFLSDYAAASKLADCDPSYLPAKRVGRRVTLVRPFGPSSRAVALAVERELEAVSAGQNDSPVDHCDLIKRMRDTLLMYLFTDANSDVKTRVLPDIPSCIYTAITNEEPSIVVVSSENHPGINESVTRWYSYNKHVKVLGVSDERRFDAWTAQQGVFIDAFRDLMRSVSDCAARVVVVLPLVSPWTGQLFDVRSLIQQVRTISPDAVVIVDASFLNIAPGGKLDDLYNADYLCLNISQWITCSEPCGILLSKRAFSFDPDWESQPAFAPANIRAVAALHTAFEHAFKRSAYFNNPKCRTDILMQKFRDVIDPRLLSIVEIPDLIERTYFLTLEPVKGRTWDTNLAGRLGKMGLSTALWQSGSHTRLTVAFPPYVDFWQVGRLATLLGESVV